MIPKLAVRITDSIIGWGYSDIRFRDVYIYNLQNRLSAFITFFLIFVAGVVMRQPLAAVTYGLFFTRLRRYTGGVHAPSTNICILFSTSLCPVIVGVSYAISLYSNNYLQLLLVAVAIVFTGVVVFVFAPVNHPDLELDANEIAVYGKKSRTVWGIEAVVLVVLHIAGVSPVVVYSAVITMVAVGLTILIAKIIKQEVRNEEAN